MVDVSGRVRKVNLQTNRLCPPSRLPCRQPASPEQEKVNHALKAQLRHISPVDLTTDVAILKGSTECEANQNVETAQLIRKSLRAHQLTARLPED